MFVIADRTYIATHMSPEAMGLYTIAGYCISLFMVLPIALNTLLYPKAAAKYGETGDKRALLPFWRKSLLLFSAVLVPLVVVAYFVIPWAVEVFLPNYEDGIEAARKIQEMTNWEVPILFVTALCDKETVMMCRNIDAAGYIVRPYKPVYIKSEIKRILREWGTEN